MTDHVGTAGPATVIISPFATPNGPLHLGHLAGPYLAGDVYARYLRARGRTVVFPAGTDDNQTYVTSSAIRRGIPPEQLLAESSDGVRRSLAAVGISNDGFVPASTATYAEAVLDFFDRLYQAGKLVLREVPLPYSERDSAYLLDGLVSGECPTCDDITCGGICESCGHPVDYAELRGLRSTVDADDVVTLRPTPLLVLPMEEYRERLAEFHRARPFRWRPHIEQVIGELLAKPLLDLPITYPLSRGIPAPFAETPGQMINPWAEAMPQCVHGSWYVQDEAVRDGGEPGSGERDALWRAETGTELVYFHGFDNAANWALTYVALLMAHDGRYIVPSAIVCNEFYELEHQKFSTSRNHVVWTADLAAEAPRDLIRFYAALTAPENQRTNFDRQSFEAVVERRLVQPWNAVAEALDKAAAGLGPDERLSTTPDGRRRAAAQAQRFRLYYEPATFSMTRAAEAIATQLLRLRNAADALPDGGAGAELADLLLMTHTLVECAAPFLIDTAAAMGIDGSFLAEGSEAAAEVGHRPAPRLALRL